MPPRPTGPTTAAGRARAAQILDDDGDDPVPPISPGIQFHKLNDAVNIR